MDAFFASIEERDNPRFRGKPLVVGADPESGRGRGVVSTANYAAPKYGIRSALPISTAWRFSEAARDKGEPPAIFLGVDMKKYGEVSRRIMAILRKYAASVEEASVDEAYFDLSSAGSYEKAREIGLKIKREIKNNEQLTASMGIGPNKLMAKIASDMEKPDGMTVVCEAAAVKFLEPLPVRTIPGIGPKTEERFRAIGIRTIKELKRLSLDELREKMGKWGVDIYEKARARDDSPLVEDWEAKSIGEQETFRSDTRDPNFIFERMKLLSDGVYEGFSNSGFKSFRTVTITVRFSDFITKTRSETLEASESSREIVRFVALKLLSPFFDSRENRERKAIRLIGVRLEKLSGKKSAEYKKSAVSM